MNGVEEINTCAISNLGCDLNVAITFLTALFDERDSILLRPIETWTEGGRKQSRVLHKHSRYFCCAPMLLQVSMPNWLETCASNKANAFFGVCPRFGNNGRYDLAWQIRTVRCLWSDIDHIEVQEALDRCREKNLPAPSIAVNSGNGAHLYWLLNQSYLIDDVGDPPAVLTEWVESSDGRKKPRRYILEGDERVYLDQRRHLDRLSEKAQRIQNILAGIAELISGDHTTDLSRLLRLPGTLNRKDERNGRAPLKTELVICEPGRRHAIAEFEQFASESVHTLRHKQIAAMPLPHPRTPSPSKSDRFAELVAASAIAPPGTRSEADFAACCYSIRSGISQEEAWNRVAEVGKFAEGGRRYFDRTWENAAYDVQADTLERLQKDASKKQKQCAQVGAGAGSAVPPDEDDGAGGNTDDDHPTIVVDPSNTQVSTTMCQITDRLLAAGGMYSRADQLVAIRNHTISPILSTGELIGLLNHYVEFYFADEEAGEFKPLPTNYANTWLNHPGERAKFPVIRLFTYNPVYGDDWRLVEPGYNTDWGIYYCGPAIPVRHDTDHLDRLLKDFCFKTPADRTNYLAFLITTILIPRFIGSKPAALFNGNQPALGKSILAQIIAIIRDGSPVDTVTYNPNDEEFEKRLGASVRRGATTIIVDNAKGSGRNPKIESACLERSITDPIVSFRLLGQSREIRAENSIVFCITANTAQVSRDLVTRSVLVDLFHEGNPTRRTFTITNPEGYAEQHRIEILGELIGMVERWKSAGMPKADTASRFNKRDWARTVGGILEANGEPGFLGNAETAAIELDETYREFAELVSVMAKDSNGEWTATALVRLAEQNGLLRSELGEGKERSKATRMGIVAGRFIAERFEVGDSMAIFQRKAEHDGSVYRVNILRNVGEASERLTDVQHGNGSAS
jgi:hypothetical protein